MSNLESNSERVQTLIELNHLSRNIGVVINQHDPTVHHLMIRSELEDKQTKRISIANCEKPRQ